MIAFMKGTKRKRREGVWELRVYVGRDPGTGTPRQISKTFYGGSRGADDALRDMSQDQAPSRTDGLGVTVGQLFDKWLEECDAYSDGFRTAVPIESVHPFRGFSYTSAGVGFVTFA